MSKRIKYLLKNISFYAMSEFSTKIITFIMIMFYTRVLTTKEYGIVDLIMTISTLVTPILMLNIGEAVMRYSLDDDPDYNKILSVGFVGFVFGLALSIIIIPILSMFDIISNYKYYIYIYILISSTKLVLIGFLRGKKNLKQFVISNILDIALKLTFNISFFLFWEFNVRGYLISYILADLITLLYIIISNKIYKISKNYCFDKQLFIKMLKYSLALIPNSLFWLIINFTDKVSVTFFCSVSDNGILAVAYKIPSLMVMFNTILMQAWKYSAIEESKSKDSEQFNNKMLNIFLRINILVCSCLILIIKPLTNILFSTAYYDAWKASSILLVAFSILSLSTFVGTVYHVKKDMSGNMISEVLCVLINITLNLLLVPKIGIVGATLGTLISFIGLFTYRYINTKKYQKLNIFKKEYIALFTLLILMVLGNLVSNYLGTLITIISFIIVILLNSKFIIENLKLILKKIKSN